MEIVLYHFLSQKTIIFFSGFDKTEEAGQVDSFLYPAPPYAKTIPQAAVF
ncbi:MAG: hypothetical protein WA081_15920 [Desulfosalsimonadaceae bacterium]